VSDGSFFAHKGALPLSITPIAWLPSHGTGAKVTEVGTMTKVTGPASRTAARRGHSDLTERTQLASALYQPAECLVGAAEFMAGVLVVRFHQPPPSAWKSATVSPNRVA
jgi:hypothetical protein